MTKVRRVAVVIDLSHQLGHHFGVFAGIERYAREHGNWECVADPFIQLVRQGSREADYDGVIARASGELARQAAELSVPMVNVWSGSPAKTLPSVLSNVRVCGQIAVEHLLRRGYRKFAFLGVLRHGGTREALDGFKAAVRAAKHPWTTRLIHSNCDETPRAWHRCTAMLEQWIATWEPPLGVVVIQDTFCRYLATACLRAGLRIPADVALIGFGNEPLVCTRLEPSLSSIDLGHERVGYEAAALLDRLMAGKPAPTGPILIEPAELIARRSTDSYVVDDPLVRAALTFIAEHSHEGVRVDDVAKHAHATVQSLRRHFRAAMGRNVTEEITRLRLERAKRLLVENDEQIKKLARDCGFPDAAYFHRVFLHVEGITPGEYRRQRRK